MTATAPDTAPPLERQLGLGAGIALAIGSVAGSGILFLPSVTYDIAGADALLVWAAAAALCVPLLLVFGELVREAPESSGLEGFVARGLGPHAAACVPLLFLVTFYPALAAACLVAGGYLEAAVGGGAPVRLAGALLVIGTVTATNLIGARGGARLQAAVMWTLLAAAVALVTLTFPDARDGYDAVVPELARLDPILAGMLVAFWAFAGFENMTFVAGEMRNPRRDYLVATLVALVAYGTLSVLLTANVAAIVPAAEVDELAGVAQLAEYVPAPGVAVAVITVLALALVQANAASWMWGTSRLLYATARDRRLPAWLARLDARGLPRRAVLTLALPGAAVTCVASVVPSLVLPFVVGASAMFAFLYLLGLAAYLRAPRPCLRRCGAALVFVFIAAVLAARGWYVLVPLGVSAIAVAVSRGRGRIGTSGRPSGRGRRTRARPRSARAGRGPRGGG
jgi:amino acid efflux transporter